jgi:phosphate transport system permease protein
MSGLTSSTATDAPARSWILRWRMLKDRLVEHAVAIGGISIILMIVLIFFYLLYVVQPLFTKAEVNEVQHYSLPGGGDSSLLLAMEEQHEVGFRLSLSGKVIFFATDTGKVIKQVDLPIPAKSHITSVGVSDPNSALVALGLSNGNVLVFHHAYKVSYPNDKRLITPVLTWPLGEQPIELGDKSNPIHQLSIQRNDEQVVLAVALNNGHIQLIHFVKETSFLSDEASFEKQIVEINSPADRLAAVRLDKDMQELYLLTQSGRLSFYNISDAESPELVQHIQISGAEEKIQDIRFLAGGISLLMSNDKGAIQQWFPVRDKDGKYGLQKIRQFKQPGSGDLLIAPEFNRKGFITADGKGEITVYHTTSERTLVEKQIAEQPITKLAIAPRANAYLAETEQGQVHYGLIHNEHPEVSWNSLWGKVWYESYPEPEYRWQSSSASNDFEPKFSLVPITFGTLKAAFYAMVIAVPLAIMGAIFTAQFMSPRMRKVVKPSIEIMEALPTVILGFLAGLWLAPFIEHYLPGVVTLLLVMPPGILLAAYAWHHVPEPIRYRIPAGWEAALLLPVILLLGWASLGLSPVLETHLFGGDVRVWMADEFGVTFDQRNAIVVGLAMGFAVIPTIFSIAEDALFAVPKHLVNGSLALGATSWQTLVRVVLLTASPGIFSAVMIGFGRAVGETMIVLMATGNTPVMDFSIFQGMRTLSANIAVEMPESEVDSTHYRVLFLAALVLFIFTFLFNTVGELVRQRLRRKYSSL